MATKKMRSPRRLKIMETLATGKTVTFEEFRDQILSPNDASSARRLWKWVTSRGAAKFGCQFEVKGNGSQVDSIRLLNVDTLVQNLQKKSAGVGATASKKKPTAVAS